MTFRSLASRDVLLTCLVVALLLGLPLVADTRVRLRPGGTRAFRRSRTADRARTESVTALWTAIEAWSGGAALEDDATLAAFQIEN